MSKYLRQPGNPDSADARHILELLVAKQLFYPASDDGTPDTVVIDVRTNADKMIDFWSSVNNSIITTAAPSVAAYNSTECRLYHKRTVGKIWSKPELKHDDTLLNEWVLKLYKSDIYQLHY